jgi:hypothetical protein
MYLSQLGLGAFYIVAVPNIARTTDRASYSLAADWFAGRTCNNHSGTPNRQTFLI